MFAKVMWLVGQVRNRPLHLRHATGFSSGDKGPVTVE